MTHSSVRSMTKVLSVAVPMFALILTGCATTRTTGGSLASIEIERKQQMSSSDCPVSVKIFNRMSGIAWDGVSYHLALRNKSGVVIGELQDIPLRYTEPGYGIVVSSQVQGARCEEITGVSLLYFGYYPTGQGQVRLSNSVVTAELR